MAGALYVGSMGWSYGFWGIYGGLKPATYLAEYSRRFNSVEINNSFYRIPAPANVAEWASQTPPEFRFAAKFPQSISHAPGLSFEEGKLFAFLRSMSQLGPKKGPLLIQLPPTFRADQGDGVRRLLEALPSGNRYAVEFRHREWFRQETYNMLRERGVALVQQAHPWLPEVHEVTAGFVYIRFEGDRNKVGGEEGAVEVDRSADTGRWAQIISSYLDEGLDVYAYFSKYYSGYPPHDAAQLVELVNLSP
jgi:uncharacterized protein YecE (DUF72 family)